MMRRLGSVLAVSAIVLLAGCGSSSKSSSSNGASGAALSKSEWISQSDAVCKSFPTDSGPSADDAKALADYLDKAAASLTTARGKFAGLKPPSDGEALQKDFLAEIDKVVGAFRSAKAKADTGDVQAAGAELEKIGSAETDALNKRLKDYGFNDCAK